MVFQLAPPYSAIAPTRTAIIGGGPGGLMTAYLLQRRSPHPCDVTLYEATARLGGKVRTLRFGAAPVAYEAGAAELYDYSHVGPDPLRDLVREFGLATRAMDGGAVVMGDAILRTDQDVRRHFGQRTCTALADFARHARSLVSPQAYYEAGWQQNDQDPLCHQRFHDLLAGAVPDEAARRYIRTAVHSDLAAEPHQTSAMYGLQNYLMNEPDYIRLYTIVGGIERLTRELARRVSARVLLGHRVVRVEPTPAGTYRVLACPRPREVCGEEFEQVVVALPNDWIPAVEWGGETLARAMHAHHVRYDYPAHYLRVSLLFRQPFWRDEIAESYFMLDAFGGCCVYDETARGSDGDGDEHSGFGVLGWLIAGEAALSMSNLRDAVLIERALDSLPRPLDRGRELFLEGRVHRWVGAVNGWPGGCPAIDPDDRHLPEPDEHPGLFVVGDYLFDSTLNGVLDSADTVVDLILERSAAVRTALAVSNRSCALTEGLR